MHCQGPSEVNTEEFSYQCRPNKIFCTLLHAVEGQGHYSGEEVPVDIFTMKKIWYLLKEYIKQRQLYDVNNVGLVHCGNDLLGRVFNVQQFTVYDAPRLILQNVEILCATDAKDHQEFPSETSPNEIESLSKDSDAHKIVVEDIQSSYPWYLKGKGQEDTDNKSEVLSIQSKETELVKDSSDDLWFLNEDDIENEASSECDFGKPELSACRVYDDGVCNFDEEDYKEIEINNTVSSRPQYVDDCFENWADSELSETDDYYDDDDDDDDDDVVIAGQRSCTDNPNNSKLSRIYSEESRLKTLAKSSNYPKKLFSNDSGERNRKKECKSLRQSHGNLKRSHSLSLSRPPDVTTTNEPISNLIKVSLRKFQKSTPAYLSTEGDYRTELCIEKTFNVRKEIVFPVANNSKNVTSLRCLICLHRSKDASIIHGKTGHQACCYQCSKRLRRKGHGCPICRRRIERVVKNYIV